jgi:hypothetical protein
MFGEPVVTNSCAFYFAHEAAGALSTRYSLRPLISRAMNSQSPGESRRGDEQSWLFDRLNFGKRATGAITSPRVRGEVGE